MRTAVVRLRFLSAVLCLAFIAIAVRGWLRPQCWFTVPAGHAWVEAPPVPDKPAINWCRYYYVGAGKSWVEAGMFEQTGPATIPPRPGSMAGWTWGSHGGPGMEWPAARFTANWTPPYGAHDTYLHGGTFEVVRLVPFTFRKGRAGFSSSPGAMVITLPSWFPVLLFGAWPVAWLIRRRRRTMPGGFPPSSVKVASSSSLMDAE